VHRPGHLAFNIIHEFRQEITKLSRDVERFGMQKISWRGACNEILDRCVKIQNRIRGHSLSSRPPSSTRNVDGDGPANVSGDLPGKRSQLDLIPFVVGVAAVGRMVLP